MVIPLENWRRVSTIESLRLASLIFGTLEKAGVTKIQRWKQAITYDYVTDWWLIQLVYLSVVVNDSLAIYNSFV
jgi:hypothetical protein